MEKHMTGTITEKQATAQLLIDFKTELMKASLFVSAFYRVEASSIFLHRYAFGSSRVAEAHLAALRLVSDEVGDNDIAIRIIYNGKQPASGDIISLMRRRRRRGFSFRNYQKWKAAL
jgi:hypothetical protein